MISRGIELPHFRLSCTVALPEAAAAPLHVKIWDVSDTCLSIWGLRAGSMNDIDAQMQDAFDAADWTNLAKILTHAARECSEWSHPWRIISATGDERWVRGTGLSPNVQETDHGKTVTWTVSIIDISHLRQTQQALQESDERFRDFAENVPGAIFRYILGPENAEEIEFMSQGCVDLWEVTPDQLGSDPSMLWQMTHADDLPGLQASVLASAKCLQPWQHSWRIITPSGRLKWVEGRGQPRRLADGSTLWNSLILDVTAQKETERRLQELRKQADEANEAKSDFLARMSHELRTPLNAIIGYADAMALGVFGSFSNPGHVQNLTYIRDSGKHLLELVNDILDLSKIESGTYEMAPEVLDVGDAFRTALSRVQGPDQPSDITGITIHVAETAPKLCCDRRALNQILVNLISNAVKFTEQDPMIELRWGRSDAGIGELTVKDNGIGISDDALPSVTQPFAQDTGYPRSAYEATRSHGIGLGLSIVKSLSDLHDAELSLNSVIGEGTTVIIRFPDDRLVS